MPANSTPCYCEAVVVFHHWQTMAMGRMGDQLGVTTAQETATPTGAALSAPPLAEQLQELLSLVR